MDLQAFTHIFPVAVDGGGGGGVVNGVDVGSDGGWSVKGGNGGGMRMGRRTGNKKGKKVSENLVNMHQMAARVTAAQRQQRPPKPITSLTRGIFARQKQCQVPVVVDEQFEIETLSVDSVDNFVTSATSELDYHRQRRSSSQSYGFDRFHL